MNAKNLLLELISKNHVKDIKEILKKENLWDNSNAWRNYGDKENNWGVIGAQQSSADVALVEKINSK